VAVFEKVREEIETEINPLGVELLEGTASQ
jgi:hypothetical protein